MEREKIILIISTVVLCAVLIPSAIVSFTYYGMMAAMANPALPGNNGVAAQNVTVIIDYNNGSMPSSFYGVSGNNALDVLEAVATVTFDPRFGRAYVVAINGYHGGGWTYRVDGYSPPVAAIQYPVHDNSVVEWIAI
ncbi:MAG: DUF4430 domain-containing protein [Candidatus Helarchaeales archaeon]